MEKWRFTSEEEKGTFYAPPAETNDGQLIVGGYNKVLYAINKDTGQQNWAFYEAQHNYVAKPLVTDDFIYAPCSDNTLYALTLDGTLKWRFETEYPQWGTPVADGDVIYLSSMDHRVYALNAQSGDLIWKTEDLNGAIEGSPVVSEDGVIYIGTLGSSVVAVNSDDGSVIWQTPTTGWVFGSPVIDKDSIIFGDLAGIVYSLDREDGSINWQVQPDTSEKKKAITEQLLLYQDALYFGTESGMFYSLNPENGTINWSQSFDAKIFSTPVASDDLIVAALMSKESLLVGMGLDGSRKWSYKPEK